MGWLTRCGKADHRKASAEQVQRILLEFDMAQAAVLRGLELASAVALAGLGARMPAGLLGASTTVTTSTTTIMGGRSGAG